MQEAILPLSVAMLAGPQIISSIIFVTRENPVKVSLSYILGITSALIIGLGISFLLFNTLFSGTNIQESDSDTGLKTIQIVFIGILIFLSIKTYLTRATAKLPKWLDKLNTMESGAAYKLGLILILFFPTDFLVMFTVGANLVQQNKSILSAVPFIFLTLFLAALPIILYILFRERMQKIMPKVRSWIESTSWAINLGVYILFIILIL